MKYYFNYLEEFKNLLTSKSFDITMDPFKFTKISADLIPKTTRGYVFSKEYL